MTELKADILLDDRVIILSAKNDTITYTIEIPFLYQAFRVIDIDDSETIWDVLIRKIYGKKDYTAYLDNFEGLPHIDIIVRNDTVTITNRKPGTGSITLTAKNCISAFKKISRAIKGEKEPENGSVNQLGKVFVVYGPEYSKYSAFFGVFSTDEKAAEFARKEAEKRPSDLLPEYRYEITERVIDDLIEF
jgi:hypothetical protein